MSKVDHDGHNQQVSKQSEKQGVSDCTPKRKSRSRTKRTADDSAELRDAEPRASVGGRIADGETPIHGAAVQGAAGTVWPPAKCEACGATAGESCRPGCKTTFAQSFNAPMVAGTVYRPRKVEGAPEVSDDGGPVRCEGPAAELPEGWYQVRSLRTGHATAGHASRFELIGTNGGDPPPRDVGDPPTLASPSPEQDAPREAEEGPGKFSEVFIPTGQHWSQSATIEEGPGKFSEVFILACELASALGATPLNKHTGCWETAIGDEWRLTINGHSEPRKDASGGTVPPYHLCASFGGMPVLMASPGGGVAMGQPGEVEADLIPVLKQAIQAASPARAPYDDALGRMELEELRAELMQCTEGAAVVPELGAKPLSDDGPKGAEATHSSGKGSAARMYYATGSHKPAARRLHRRGLVDLGEAPPGWRSPLCVWLTEAGRALLDVRGPSWFGLSYSERDLLRAIDLDAQRAKLVVLGAPWATSGEVHDDGGNADAAERIRAAAEQPIGSGAAAPTTKEGEIEGVRQIIAARRKSSAFASMAPLGWFLQLADAARVHLADCAPQAVAGDGTSEGALLEALERVSEGIEREDPALVEGARLGGPVPCPGCDHDLLAAIPAPGLSCCPDRPEGWPIVREDGSRVRDEAELQRGGLSWSTKRTIARAEERAAKTRREIAAALTRADALGVSALCSGCGADMRKPGASLLCCFNWIEQFRDAEECARKRLWEPPVVHFSPDSFAPLCRAPMVLDVPQHTTTSRANVTCKACKAARPNLDTYPCAACGCAVLTHEADDEERRACRDCDGPQYEAPNKQHGLALFALAWSPLAMTATGIAVFAVSICAAAWLLRIILRQMRAEQEWENFLRARPPEVHGLGDEDESDPACEKCGTTERPRARVVLCDDCHEGPEVAWVDLSHPVPGENLPELEPDLDQLRAAALASLAKRFGPSGPDQTIRGGEVAARHGEPSGGESEEECAARLQAMGYRLRRRSASEPEIITWEHENQLFALIEADNEWANPVRVLLIEAYGPSDESGPRHWAIAKRADNRTIWAQAVTLQRLQGISARDLLVLALEEKAAAEFRRARAVDGLPVLEYLDEHAPPFERMAVALPLLVLSGAPAWALALAAALAALGWAGVPAWLLGAVVEPEPGPPCAWCGGFAKHFALGCWQCIDCGRRVASIHGAAQADLRAELLPLGRAIRHAHRLAPRRGSPTNKELAEYFDLASRREPGNGVTAGMQAGRRALYEIGRDHSDALRAAITNVLLEFEGLAALLDPERAGPAEATPETRDPEPDGAPWAMALDRCVDESERRELVCALLLGVVWAGLEVLPESEALQRAEAVRASAVFAGVGAALGFCRMAWGRKISAEVIAQFLVIPDALAERGTPWRECLRCLFSDKPAEHTRALRLAEAWARAAIARADVRPDWRSLPAVGAGVGWSLPPRIYDAPTMTAFRAFAESCAIRADGGAK